MELWIAFFLLLLTFLVSKEGFNPSNPETRPDHYPDQTMYGDLIATEKYIQLEITSTEDENKKRMLTDLLNLLQFI
jgi:hypothetical protein